MEGNRRTKGGGNQITFLKNAGDKFQAAEVTSLLKEMGFKKEDVAGVQENVFRPSQIEVTFEKNVKLEIERIESKIKEKELPYTAGYFGYYEE